MMHSDVTEMRITKVLHLLPTIGVSETIVSKGDTFPRATPSNSEYETLPKSRQLDAWTHEELRAWI